MTEQFNRTKYELENAGLDTQCSLLASDFIQSAEWLGRPVRLRLHDNCKPYIAVTLRWYMGERE